MKPLYVFYDRSYSYARSIIAVIAGLILVIWPDVAIKTIVTVIGSLLIAVGVISVILSNLGKYKEEKPSLMALNGVVDIAFGLVLVIFPAFFASLIWFLFGLVLLLFGAGGIISLVQSQKYLRHSAALYISPVLTTIAGIVVFFNPFSTMEWLFIFFGIMLLLYGLNELIAAIIIRMRIKKELKDEQSSPLNNSDIARDVDFEEIK